MTETIRKINNEIQPVNGNGSFWQINDCRRLVAQRYLDSGYIKDSDIDSEGLMSEEADPYVNHSKYFWSEDESGEITATLRMITIPDNDDKWLLPIERELNLFDDKREVLSRQKQESPSSVVEISALAKKKGSSSDAVLDMYKNVWQYAKRNKIQLCAISADAKLDEVLTGVFGGAISRAGEQGYYMGSTTVPSLLEPDSCAGAMADIYQSILSNNGADAASGYRLLVDYLRDGLEPEYFTDKEKQALETMGVKI